MAVNGPRVLTMRELIVHPEPADKHGWSCPVILRNSRTRSQRGLLSHSSILRGRWPVNLNRNVIDVRQRRLQIGQRSQA